MGCFCRVGGWGGGVQTGAEDFFSRWLGRKTRREAGWRGIGAAGREKPALPGDAGMDRE